MTTPPHIGTFTFAYDEVVEPGSDTNWYRVRHISNEPPLGASKNTIVELAAGSQLRSFTLQVSQDRYLTLQALEGTVVDFLDWLANEKTVYLMTVKQQTGSRPFLARVLVELVEQ